MSQIPVLGKIFYVQNGLERIHIVQGKLRLLDSLHAEEDIQQPALGFDIRGLDELGLAPLLQNFVSAFRKSRKEIGIVISLQCTFSEKG